MPIKKLIKKTLIGFINNFYSFLVFFFFVSSLRPLSFLVIIFLIAEWLPKIKLVKFINLIWFFICFIYYVLLLNVSGYFSNNFIILVISSIFILIFLLFKDILTGKILFIYWLIIGYFIYLYYFNFLIIAFILFTLLLLKIDFFSKETILLLKKRALILSLFSTFMGVRFFLFFVAYNGENPNTVLKKIAQEKGLKIIATIKNKSSLNEIIKNGQVFFVGESYNKKNLFFGSQGIGKGLIIFNKKSKKIYVNKSLKESSDNMYISCQQPFLYAGDHKNNRVYYFNQDNIKQPKKIFKLSVISPTFISKYKDNLYINTEGNSLQIVNLKKKKEVTTIKNFSIYSIIYKNGIISYSNGIIKIYEIYKDSLQLKKEVKLKLTVHKLFSKVESFSVDEKRELLFLPSFSQGVLYIIDLKNSKLLKTLKLKKGLRFSKYNPQKNLVFVVSYISGDIFVIDVKKKKLIKTFYVGPRARNISFSCDGNRAFVASSVGAFEININSITSH